MMSRLAIALVLVLASVAANAQDGRPGSLQTPAAPSGNEMRPFLFDGRLPGDGARRQRVHDDRRRNAGTIVVPPKESQPE
jgi:hypothetical protein